MIISHIYFVIAVFCFLYKICDKEIFGTPSGINSVPHIFISQIKFAYYEADYCDGLE